MSIKTIISALVTVALVSAQNVPVITGVYRKLEGTDAKIDDQPAKDVDEPKDDDDEDQKEPETQEEAEKRIIAAAKEKGTKLPEIVMLEPMVRMKTDRNIPNKQPCGNTEPGHIHLLTQPGARNFFQWRTIKPVSDGNCTVRFGTGLDEDEFTVLKPRDGTADKNGAFPCGRNVGYEGKEFRMPKGQTCSSCTLQFEWQVGGGEQIHQCSDITLSDLTVADECDGSCENGGACVNGLCKCRKGYYGSECQNKDEKSSNFFFYMLIALGLIGLAAALFYGAMALKNKLASMPQPAVVEQHQLPPDRLTADVDGSPDYPVQPPPTAAQVQQRQMLNQPYGYDD